MQWLGTLLAAAVMLCVISLQGSWLVFVDVPSFVFVLLVGGGITVSAHGCDAVRIAWRAVRGRLDAAETEDAYHVMRTGVRAFVGAGWLGGIIGVVQLLSALDDPTRAGPAAALALLTLFYGYALAYLGCMPLGRSLARRHRQRFAI